MSRASRQLAVILSSLSFTACAPTSTGISPSAGPAAAETITLSVGPCFGFCPVYTVSISPAGAVGFNGERHTAVLGEKTRMVDAETYRKIARQLAPFRPSEGDEVAVECSAAVSDTSPFTVTWIDAGGRDRTAIVASGWARAQPGTPELANLELRARRQGAGLWAAR